MDLFVHVESFRKIYDKPEFVAEAQKIWSETQDLKQVHEFCVSKISLPESLSPDINQNFKKNIYIKPGYKINQDINQGIKPGFNNIPGKDFSFCCQNLKRWKIWNEGLVVKREGPENVKQAVKEMLRYEHKANEPSKYFWKILRRIQEENAEKQAS
jgi:hypothetical protein